jgi:2-polyprenyl-6-methoxyphenol hydroxylase-like FAD-dependent oxidoreductase
VSFTSGEKQVTVRSENGHEETRALLVGGDGAWSAMREQLVQATARTGQHGLNIMMNQAVQRSFSASESASKRVMNE